MTAILPPLTVEEPSLFNLSETGSVDMKKAVLASIGQIYPNSGIGPKKWCAGLDRARDCVLDDWTIVVGSANRVLAIPVNLFIFNEMRG